MKKIAIVALALMALAAPVTARAGDVVVPYENLQSVLSGYHGMPDAGYWNRLDAESARSNLMKLAGDTGVHTIVRARALSALAYFKNGAVTSLMADTAFNDGIAYMRSAAFEAIGAAGGTDAVDTLSRAYEDGDVMVRLAATRALMRIGGPKARAALERSLAKEENTTARAVISKSLERIR